MLREFAGRSTARRASTDHADRSAGPATEGRCRRRSWILAATVSLAVVALSGCGSQTQPQVDHSIATHVPPIKPPALKREGAAINGVTVSTSGTKKLVVVTEPFSISTTDASVGVVRQHASRYVITVTNTSPYAYLDSFVFQPTSLVTIRSVTSHSGNCLLIPGAIPNHRAVSCTSLKLVPPPCVCKPDGTVQTVGSGGGSLSLDLVVHIGKASKYIGVGTVYQRLRGLPKLGVLTITGETLVLHTKQLKSGSHVRILNLHG